MWLSLYSLVNDWVASTFSLSERNCYEPGCKIDSRAPTSNSFLYIWWVELLDQIEKLSLSCFEKPPYFLPIITIHLTLFYRRVYNTCCFQKLFSLSDHFSIAQHWANFSVISTGNHTNGILHARQSTLPRSSKLTSYFITHYDWQSFLGVNELNPK